MILKGRYSELDDQQKQILKSAAICKNWKMYWGYKYAFLCKNERKNKVDE